MIRKILVFVAEKTGLHKFCGKTGRKMENRKLHSSFRRYGLEALIQADKAFRSIGSFLDGGVLQENIAVLLEKYGFPARLS
jgi:hypothetical protein